MLIIVDNITVFYTCNLKKTLTVLFARKLLPLKLEFTYFYKDVLLATTIFKKIKEKLRNIPDKT